MAGTITHQWVGTTLIITSDSGTSACDLKGDRGDMGIRGPQGCPGIVRSEDGTIDFTAYATTEYVDEQINAVSGVDSNNYYTKEQVNAEIAKAQLSGGEVNLDSYYTKSETDAAIDSALVNIDLADYYTTTETNNRINSVMDLHEASKPHITEARVSELIAASEPDLSGYYTKTEVDSKISALTMYNLTDDDKEEIALMALALIPRAEEEEY